MQIVAHCCERALAAGITPGMTLAHARALLQVEPQVQECHPHGDAQSLKKLAMWAQRYSPIVAADPPDGLLIDIAGCQRVFGGEEQLAQCMVHDLNRLGLHARVAMASTFACAWGVARYHRHEGRKARRYGGKDKQRHFVPSCLYAFVPPGQERAALAPLPLHALRIDHSIIDALHEVEIIRIGQLFDLPRSQLADRYGEALLLRLDQACGDGGAIEAIEPVRLKDPPRVAHVFDGPVLQIEGIELMTRALLEQLHGLLLKLERGVCKLDVEFTRIDAPPMRFSVRLSHPSRNVRHLWSLLKPKIETINLGFGVEAIAIIASRSRVVSHPQDEFTAEHAESAENIQYKSVSAFSATSAVKCLNVHAGEFIDTLCNRLGNDRVLQVQARESHVPERSFRFSSALDDQPLAPGSAGGTSEVEGERPTLLLPRPESIAVELDQHQSPHSFTWHGVRSAIIACIGPEAIASEWWKESPSGLREYYKAQDEWGNWLWMYYEHVSDQWFLHGVWA